jgi:hypothetical protein
LSRRIREEIGQDGGELVEFMLGVLRDDTATGPERSKLPRGSPIAASVHHVPVLYALAVGDTEQVMEHIGLVTEVPDRVEVSEFPSTTTW